MLPFVFLIFGYSISPSYASDIISCDGFDSCPANCAPVNLVLNLEARVAELEAEVIARTADLTGAYLTDAIWSNTTCPDGSNSDTNGLNACVP